MSNENLQIRPKMLILTLCSCLTHADFSSAKDLAKAEKPPAQKKVAKIDSRAVATFQRAIEAYKQFQSLNIAANEAVFGVGAPLYRSYVVNLQLPLRASLDTFEEDIPAKNKRLIERYLIDKDSFRQWNVKTGEHQRLLASGQDRNAAIVEIFKSSPLLALSLVSLCGGVNPAQAPIAQKATLEMTDENGEREEIVHLTVADDSPSKTASLDFCFSAKTHLLKFLILSRERANRIQILSLDKLVYQEKAGQNQDATDQLIYSWKTPNAK